MIPWLSVVPWRAVAAGALTAAVALAGWRVSAWRDAYRELPELRAELQAEVACEEGSECWRRQQEYLTHVGQETMRIVSDYEAELAAARARPARVVRVCPDARGVRDPGAAAGGDGTGAGATALPEPTGRDIGPGLYALARDADAVSARLRACQGWARAVSTADD